ncbi:MAG TPA: class I SAM-dependent methyltransferase [Frankiaceae bacterium]
MTVLHPLPEPLEQERTAALAAATAAATPAPPGGQEPAGLLGRGRRLLRAPDRGRRLRNVAVRSTRRGAERLLGPTLTELQDTAALTRARLAQAEGELAALRRAAAGADVALAEGRAAAVNTELLKAEVRDLERTLADLGWSIAPATGIDGVGVRFAELRERVNGLDRRLRQAATASAAAAAPAAAPVAPAAPAAGGAPAAPPRQVQSALFDYVGFERRFRGDPEQVLQTLSDRYAELLSAHAPVLDLGCGRAELIELLTQRGVDARGVDSDPGMVAEAQARGLAVVAGDALGYLRALPEHSLGSIIATHVVEHLELDVLVELLELAVTRLRPGGVFVAETPNPASLIVLGNSYILDPTHVRPLHPSLLAFLCEGAGFRDVRLAFHEPATDYHLAEVTAPDAPEWVAQLNANVRRLNDVLFGPQEYAVIATTPEATPAGG